MPPLRSLRVVFAKMWLLPISTIAVLIAASGLSARLAAADQSPATLRPNIIFILADDIGIDWISSYGADQATPALDKLAERGVRFETMWTAPLCTPTRVTLLTGQYNGRLGWTEHYDVPRWGGDGLMPERFPTWPRILHDSGYVTAVVGKWQINDLRSPTDILQRHGFDKHCMWTGVEAGNPVSEARYWNAYLQIDGQRAVHTGEYGPDVCQAYALQFIREHQKEPFLLYYPMIEVHTPIEPTPLNRAHPPEGQKRLYADAVTYMDMHVGQLIDELDRLGIRENTVIVFMGDNGSTFSGSMHGKSVPSGKGRATDHGAHVPMIVSATMLTPGGWVSRDLADNSDVFATMLELGGVSQAGYPVDGQSWVPLLRHDAGFTPRSWVYTQRDEARAVRNQRYKLNSDGNFFDLLSDPNESHPLGSKLDAEAARTRALLEKVLARLPANASVPPFASYTPERMRQVMAGVRSRRNAAEPPAGN